MYAINLPNQQPGYVYLQTTQPLSQQSRRSGALIGFGILQLIFSLLLLCWCIIATLALTNSNIYVTYIGISSCVFHITTGIVGIVGGQNVIQNRCSVIATLVLGIIGCCSFCVAVITTDIFDWTSFSHFCCEECGRQCHFSPEVIHLPILIATSLQAILDIILSSITCCNTCRCCDGSEMTPVLAQPTYGTNPFPCYPPYPVALPNATSQTQQYNPPGSHVQQENLQRDEAPPSYQQVHDRNPLL